MISGFYIGAAIQCGVLAAIKAYKDAREAKESEAANKAKPLNEWPPKP